MTSKFGNLLIGVDGGAGGGVGTPLRTGYVRGFYGPGRPATPDAAARAAPYARAMTVTTEFKVRRYRDARRPVEQSARSKRRAHTSGRPTDTASDPREVAARPRLETGARPDPGTEPRYMWQAIGGAYDHLRPRSK